MYQLLSNTQKLVCIHRLTLCNMCQPATHTKASRGSNKDSEEGEGGRYCVMKGDQSVSHTFLWADHHHLSSSARWELGRHGPHT